jgi:hypothetical protein
MFKNGSVTVSVEVTNIGSRAGEEIVQLYVHPKVAYVTQPEGIKGLCQDQFTGR